MLGVIVAAASVAAGCGSTHATTKSGNPTYHRPPGQHFQGRSSATIGVVRVRRRSTLTWASDGLLFQLTAARGRIDVRSQSHAGHLTLAPGTYRAVKVVAFGSWIVTISPG